MFPGLCVCCVNRNNSS